MSKATAKANNRQRADNGRAILAFYVGGEPREESLRDMLADLMHAFGPDTVDRECMNAATHFEAESKPDDLASDPGVVIAPLTMVTACGYAFEESQESPYIDFEPRLTPFLTLRAFLAATGYDFSAEDDDDGPKDANPMAWLDAERERNRAEGTL